MQEKELLLKKLKESPSEINFPRLCQNLDIDYNQLFVPLYQGDVAFRKIILAHVDRIKYQIIERITNRALGLPSDGTTTSLAHARFILDLIATGEILPKVSKMDGEKSSIPKALRDRLKLSNSVVRMSAEERKVVVEKSEDGDEDSEED